MHVLVIRHAIAEDRDDFAKTGKPDDLRPLTADGRAKMARCARGLRALVPEISVLATSPLARAQETAEIVADQYDIEVGSTTEALRPHADFAAFIEWIADRADRQVVAIVGHEPHLSALVTWLLTGVDDSHIELKKGGGCLIAFKGMPEKGSGTLDWLLQPSQLRKIGKER